MFILQYKIFIMLFKNNIKINTVAAIYNDEVLQIP